ncbi:putative leucine-rich repeat receptor-like serine/threonine-protein kinase At2g24130 [Aegilops tauschii subsp. strangulata]|uniref:putative leucine-rich repeat receptor-like serine/threonine-protein kinase At2g24130 n=1 Tax=Aegilops tauschii subsp. strangulata TaxID=200361 RepID=UPI003CC8AA37
MACVAWSGLAARVTQSSRRDHLDFLFGVLADPGGTLTDWGRLPRSCNWTDIACGRGPADRRCVTQLVLSDRGIHGFLSPALGRLSVLVVFDLSSNAFAGEDVIPSGIRLLQQLYYLDLSANRLSGGIPERLFCNCSTLQYMDLAGDIPYAAECRLPSLRYILLWSNKLSGPIPLALPNSLILEWVDSETNYRAAKLPSQVFDRLPWLQYLYLSYNNLSTHDGNTNLDPFFRSLRNCTRLQELELAANGLGGKLPSFIGELSCSFQQIHLEDNAISGSIPPNIICNI